jgi:alkylation response protein AidB-like acyl-CoA dehydrogenase
MQSSLDVDDTHDMFSDGLDRYLKSRSGEIPRAAGAIPSRIWSGLAEMGVMGLSVSEESGGVESARHLCAAMEILGRHLLNPSGIIAGVMGSRLLRAAAPGSCDALLPKLAEGAKRLAVADGCSFDTAPESLHATADGSGFVLNGIARQVVRGDVAEQILISCPLAGNPASRQMLFLFSADELRDQIEDFRLIDGSFGSLIRFPDTRVAAACLIAEDAGDAIDDAMAWGLLCLCWEATGAMSRLLDMTRSYAKTRRQFGVPIGSFQALQHMMVDMLVHTELARDAALLAAAHIEATDRIEKRTAFASAKFQIGQSAKFVRERAVQIHGAIGMTDEIDVTKLFRRLMVVEQTLGSSDDHMETLVGTGFERHSASDG